MMRWVVSRSLRFRFLVVAVAATLVFLGIAGLHRTPVDVFPEFAPPTVEVQTECVGLAPPEVESLVTVPIEEALNGIAHVSEMRSQSVSQLSDIQLIFQQGTDVLRARELVQERLATVRPTLPNWAAPPDIIPPKSATSRVLFIGMTSTAMSPIDLSVLAVNTVRARLLRVPGVANVSVWGERQPLLQVQADPARLGQLGLSLSDLMGLTSDALDNGSLKYEVSGVTGAGGAVVTANQQLPVEHDVPIVTPDQLASTVVQLPSGTPVRIGDIAHVVLSSQPLIGDAVVNGGPGLLLIVDKFPWGNTLQVTHGIDAALKELRPGLAGVRVDPTIFRPATFIDDAIHNLTDSIVLGSLLVLLVLSLFLFEWRSALISIVTIPVSLTASLLVLHLRHATINTMILAGLVIALGAIVDDAIVDIENIVRRLRQHRASGSTASTASVILESSIEVRSAVVYASFIEVVALIPIFFLHGLTGAFFKPLASAYALSVLVSLGVALVLTPSLALILLRGAPLERSGSPVAHWLKAHYERLLGRVVRRPLPAVTATIAIILAGAAVLPRLGESLFPTFKERDFLIHWISKPGTSLPEEDRVTVQASDALRAIPGVRDFGSHIGRAIQGEEIVGVNSGENWISIDPHADYASTLGKVQDTVAGIPGLFRDVQTYLRERTKEVLTGSSDAIVVRIFGPDLTVLHDKAQEVERLVAGVKGTIDSNVEFQENVPQIQVEVNLAAAQRFGVTPGEVRRTASTLIGGEEVGAVFKDGVTYDVWVWSPPSIRTSPQSVQDLLVDSSTGGQVRIGDIAQVAVVSAPNVIKHEGVFRRIDVGTNVSGRDLGSVSRDIKARLAKVTFPPGYHAEVLGEYAERQSAQRRLISFAIASAVGVLLLLRLSFRRWRLAALAFLTLPIALVGGELAAYFNGATISLGSLVGFFTVLGIVARNGIMMISHYQHLETHEGEVFGPELVIRGAGERLAPILMTGLATALALVPLVIRGPVPGQEIEYPLAIVILGGLLASALLNLFILPTLYLRFGRTRRPQSPSQSAATSTP